MEGLFTVVRKAVHPQTIELLKNALLIERDIIYMREGVCTSELGRFGGAADDPVTTGPHYNKYANLAGEALMVTLLPLIQNITGKRLFPTYTFTRFYYKDNILHPHKDRPSCEYSMTLCIEADPEPWGIWVEGTEVLLNPGDVVVYKGCDALHWRDPYKGNRNIQMFLHYVDADGRNSEFRFDRRPILGIDSEHGNNN